MTDKRLSAEEAVAEAWASIDGKLDEFRSANQTLDEQGYRDGYLSEAHELLERVARRGYKLVPTDG